MQPLALPVWLAGLVWYFAAAEGKRFRFLGWAYLIVLAIFIVLGGKSYYALPVYPVLMAAGGVALEGFFAAPARRWMAVAFPALLIVAGLVTLPFGAPILPVDTFLALFAAAAVREFGEDRARRDDRAAATVRRHVRLGKYGRRRLRTSIARCRNPNRPAARSWRAITARRARLTISARAWACRRRSAGTTAIISGGRALTTVRA